MADDDAFLTLALHIDDSMNINAVVGLLERIHTHLNSIRNLFVVIKQNLLTNNLAHEEACRFVGQLILFEIGWRVGQQLLDAFQQHVNTKFVGSRDGQNLRIGKQRVPLLDKVAKRLLVAHINLVDEQQNRNLHLRHLLQEIHVLLGVLHHIGHIEQHVGISQRTLRERQHHLLHLVVGLQHTRRIAEDNLHVISVHNAHDAMTRCLSLEGGYRDAFTHELVHQR